MDEVPEKGPVAEENQPEKESPEDKDEEVTKLSGEDNDIVDGELSGTDLLELEKDLNSIKYNGFMVQEFADPESIYWDEVFYLGADLDRSSLNDQLLTEEYTKETGEEELDTDIDFIDRKEAEAFAEETTGVSYSEMKHPISFVYLKGSDAYANVHGDTNQRPVKLLKGSVDDGVMTIRYIYEPMYEADEESSEYELKIRKNGDGYEFISNLWTPEEGREEAIKKIYDEIIEKYAKGISEGWGMNEFQDNNLCYLAGYLKDKASWGDDRDPMEIAG